MDYNLLEQVFSENTEMESARLISGNFDAGTFSLIKPIVPETIATYIDLAIKHKQHLSMDKMMFSQSLDKLVAVDLNSSNKFNGKASSFLTYSGKTLEDSKTFASTADELVSYNEVNYFIKMYPWWVKTNNPEFQEYVAINTNNLVFICNSDFDMNLLNGKSDVKAVTSEKIVLKDNTVLTIVRV